MRRGYTSIVGLSEQQRYGIKLLAEGRSRESTATELGVHPGTVSRWGKNEEFTNALKVARQESGQESTPHRTLKALLDAVDADGHPDNRVRFSAAVKLIELGGAPSKPGSKPKEDGVAYRMNADNFMLPPEDDDDD